MDTFRVEVHQTPARTPLSLRVPTPLLENVQEYATAHGITRTDAFLRLVELGLETDSGIIQQKRLFSLNKKIDRILELLENEASVS